MTRRVHIRTFGCQMNVHDSERMSRLMELRGWEKAEGTKDADLIVINTCSVREKAYQKVRSAVGALKPLIEAGRSRRPVIAVAGCVARQEGQRWLEYCPHLDIVLGPDAIARLPAHVEAILDGSPPVVDVQFDEGRAEDFLAPLDSRVSDRDPTAFVTVMKGCSHRCTYCIVPAVRGPMRHRPSKDIVEEVRRLVDVGVAEVTLLGQTVNAWHEPDDDQRDFAWLLGRLDRIDGLKRLRYTSPHPIYVTDSLIRAHGQLGSLCEHVHLPVQSGSDQMLKRMGRRHDREHFLRITDALQGVREGMTLSTDLIVGFPGETQRQFEDTLSLVERVRFDTFFSFMYSERPGTPASRWDDDISAALKRERLFTLHQMGERITAQMYARDLDRNLEVLVEGTSRSGGEQMTGRTRTGRIVNFAGEDCNPGDLVDIVITQVMPHCLKGRLS